MKEIEQERPRLVTEFQVESTHLSFSVLNSLYQKLRPKKHRQTGQVKSWGDRTIIEEIEPFFNEEFGRIFVEKCRPIEKVVPLDFTLLVLNTKRKQ